MIDAFAEFQGIPMTTHYFKALFGEGLCPSICAVKESLFVFYFIFCMTCVFLFQSISK
jgi:hypothetical protein